MADNYRVDVVGDSREVFDTAIRLAYMSFGGVPKLRAATRWAVTNNSLVLLRWGQPTGSVELPFELSVEAAIPFCWDWLQQQLYPAKPDLDGTTKPGFWVTTTDAKDVGLTSVWHSPGGIDGGIVRVAPIWCMYGK